MTSMPRELKEQPSGLRGLGDLEGGLRIQLHEVLDYWLELCQDLRVQGLGPNDIGSMVQSSDA